MSKPTMEPRSYFLAHDRNEYAYWLCRFTDVEGPRWYLLLREGDPRSVVPRCEQAHLSAEDAFAAWGRYMDANFPEAPPPIKCIVFGCTNLCPVIKPGELPNVCEACFQTITTGLISPSDSFIGSMHRQLKGQREDAAARHQTLNRIKDILDTELER